jgi:hypothetical protein
MSGWRSCFSADLEEGGDSLQPQYLKEQRNQCDITCKIQNSLENKLGFSFRFLPVLDSSEQTCPLLSKKATTQPKKVLIFTTKLWKLALFAQI